MNKIKLLKIIFVLPLLASCSKVKAGENKGWNMTLKSFYVNDNLEYANNKECKVILLYGQSNATGCTSNKFLDANDPSLYNTYEEGFNNVKINYVIEGNSTLTGHSFVDLKLSNTNVGATFGPEMGIGEEYNKFYPNTDIFIIKYTWGGSSLENEWLTCKDNRNYMYYNAINFTKKNLDYLKKIGYKINIEGICWMQGECDAFENIYQNYYDNTTKLVNYFREDLNKYQSEIKFVDAYIKDIDLWPKYAQINEQKYNYSTTSNLNYLVDTIALNLRTDEEPYSSPDIAHYDSLSMVTLGREFAKTLINN